MKYLLAIFLFTGTVAYAQLTMNEARSAAAKYQLGSYSYHEQFIGHQGYGAPIILTADGGTAIFGDYTDQQGSGGLLVKLNRSGKEEWKRMIRPEFDEIESQSVVQDSNGNYYVFVLSYDKKRYRGGSQRVVYLNKSGAIVWDKTIGTYDMINSPTFSYIRALRDGRISLRGHIATEQPPKGKDPVYYYWEGWITSDGKLTQQKGEAIDWAKQEWQKWYKPE